MHKDPPHVIRTAKQHAALAAAPRQEIVDVLEQMGKVSVAELASALGRPADAMYFHLRALTRAGLVRNAGSRSRHGRPEALYCTVAPELRLEYKPESASNRKAVSAIIASMLRLTIRDFRRSFQPGNVAVSGPSRELWALRKVGRLSLAQLARLNTGIADLAGEMSIPGEAPGRLYAVTIVLTPIDRRSRAPRHEQQPKRKAAGKKL